MELFEKIHPHSFYKVKCSYKYFTHEDHKNGTYGRNQYTSFFIHVYQQDTRFGTILVFHQEYVDDRHTCLDTFLHVPLRRVLDKGVLTDVMEDYLTKKLCKGDCDFIDEQGKSQFRKTLIKKNHTRSV